MKKVFASLLVMGTMLFAADQTIYVEDCAESLENEIIGIIYSGQMKGEQADALSTKIKRSFEQRCTEAEAAGDRVLVIEKTADIKDCIKNLENEILGIISSSPDQSVQEMDIKILIDNVSQNFEECRAVN
jgi:hypothetical protein